MTLRTSSVRRQRQAWACLALLGVVAYFVLVLSFGLGNPLRFFGAHQMRVLLPLVVVLRILAREFRWDGVVREEKVEDQGQEGSGEKEVKGQRSGVEQRNLTSCAAEPLTGGQGLTALPVVDSDGRAGSPLPAAGGQQKGEATSSSLVQNESDAQRRVHCSPPPHLSTSRQPQPPASASSPAALWERARVMVHNVIPDFDEDAEYLNLVFSAAEQGHVPALAKLGDYAFRRGAFVEAYFWTKIAKRRLELAADADPQGLKEIGDMLKNIRREWTAAGQPSEYENRYENFPEERGRIGRAFLRIDSGIQANRAREFVCELAKRGNPDAALFVS